MCSCGRVVRERATRTWGALLDSSFLLASTLHLRKVHLTARIGQFECKHNCWQPYYQCTSSAKWKMWCRYMDRGRRYALCLCVFGYSFGTCEYILTWIVDILDSGLTTKLRVCFAACRGLLLGVQICKMSYAQPTLLGVHGFGWLLIEASPIWIFWKAVFLKMGYNGWSNNIEHYNAIAVYWKVNIKNVQMTFEWKMRGLIIMYVHGRNAFCYCIKVVLYRVSQTQFHTIHSVDACKAGYYHTYMISFGAFISCVIYVMVLVGNNYKSKIAVGVSDAEVVCYCFHRSFAFINTKIWLILKN